MLTIVTLEDEEEGQRQKTLLHSGIAKLRTVMANTRPLSGVKSFSVEMNTAQGITKVELPPGIFNAFFTLASAIDQGGAAAVTSLDEELTPDQAARLLRVSRPYVMKLIESGTLSTRKVGTHHHLSAREVMLYREKDIKNRREALRKLAALDAELGME